MSRLYSIHAGAARSVPCLHPVLRLFFPFFSPVVSARIPPRMIDSAPAGASGEKNREISTNKLLQTRISYLNQMVGERRKRRESLIGANPVDRFPSWSPIARTIADTRCGVALGGRA
jgi:hypothetical protein